jgi:hypothetical protein
MAEMLSKFRPFGLALYSIGSGVLGLVLAAPYIFSLWIRIPFQVHVHMWTAERIRQRGWSFPCLTCGRKLRYRATGLADKEWRRYKYERSPDWPLGTSFPFPRTIHAICPHCGARYDYIKNADTFALLAPVSPDRHVAPLLGAIAQLRKASTLPIWGGRGLNPISPLAGRRVIRRDAALGSSSTACATT